jgi:hypothetical protein
VCLLALKHLVSLQARILVEKKNGPVLGTVMLLENIQQFAATLLPSQPRNDIKLDMLI